MVEAVVQMQPSSHVAHATVTVLPRKVILAGHAAVVDMSVPSTLDAIVEVVMAIPVEGVFRMFRSHAARITSIGGQTPVHISNESAPWAINIPSPSKAVAPASRAWRSSCVSIGR